MAAAAQVVGSEIATLRKSENGLAFEQRKSLLLKASGAVVLPAELLLAEAQLPIVVEIPVVSRQEAAGNLVNL